MANGSFIKEAYTNLCKDKDTYFYNIINKTDTKPQPQIISTSEGGVNSNMECKKKCIEKYKEKCGLYTIKDNNTCTMYQNDGNNFKDYNFLVDCGGKDYKEIPLQANNDPIKLSPHNSVVFGEAEEGNITHNNSGSNGVGFIDPKIYRENPSIFRNVNFAEDLAVELIDLFEKIKLAIVNFTQDKVNQGSRNTELGIYETAFNRKMEATGLSSDILDGFEYTVDLYTRDLLINFKKKKEILCDYLKINDDELFYHLIPKERFFFRIKSIDGVPLDIAGGEVIGKFSLDFDNSDLTNKQFLENEKNNLIIQVTIGSENAFKGTELETNDQRVIAKKFIDLKKKSNNLKGEHENIEIQSKKQKQTMFVYALIFIIGIITVTGFFDTKISMILFIISIFIILFINYYMDLKNLINFKDYMKHI